jgi:hypothetical protein
MLRFMRWQRCSWFLALLAVAGALFLASCGSQEGVGPGEGELRDRPTGDYNLQRENLTKVLACGIFS